MINLRYHVVSITAVFLALGIGLTLGSSFLDRVTVDNLKNRLDAVQERVDATESENNALSDRVDAFSERDAAFANELPGRVLRGHLTAVPVLLIATEGTGEGLVTDAEEALVAAGAQVAGTWWLTDPWALDDPGETDRLAALLELTTDDPDRLRQAAALRLAELLAMASQPPAAEIDPATGQPIADPAPVAPPATEPELVRQLREAGFIRYERAPGSDDGLVLLPGASSRFVVLSSARAGSGPEVFAGVLLEALVASGPAPVVAAQGLTELPAAGDSASSDERRTTFVGPLRRSETARDRLSTIDDLDAAAGLVALVLALEDFGIPRSGHYGVATGATTLLPGPDPNS